MSLEQAIADNTAALKELIAVVRESNEGRATALAAVEKVAGAAGSTGEGKGKAGGKKADKAEPPPPPAGPTVEAVRDAAKKFVTVENEGERAARKDFLRTLIDRFNVPANSEGKKFITDVAAEHRQDVIDAFESYGSDAGAAATDEDDIG